MTSPGTQQPSASRHLRCPAGPALVVRAEARGSDGLTGCGVHAWAVSAHIWPQGSAWRVVIPQGVSVRWPAGPDRPRPSPPGPPRTVLRPVCPLNASALDPAAGADVSAPHQKPPALPLPALRSPQRGFQGNAPRRPPPPTGWLPNKASAGRPPPPLPEAPGAGRLRFSISSILCTFLAWVLPHG